MILFMIGVVCIAISAITTTSYVTRAIWRKQSTVDVSKFLPSWMFYVLMIAVACVVGGVVWGHMIHDPILPQLRHRWKWGIYGADPFLAECLLRPPIQPRTYSSRRTMQSRPTSYPYSASKTLEMDEEEDDALHAPSM
jgi:hypothetical protein